jgi:hypothetical protein
VNVAEIREKYIELLKFYLTNIYLFKYDRAHQIKELNRQLTIVKEEILKNL